MLKIPALGIERDLRDKVLRTKPLESYSSGYVVFVVRTALTSTLGIVGPISAIWNERRKCWEGKLKYRGEDLRWAISR